MWDKLHRASVLGGEAGWPGKGGCARFGGPYSVAIMPSALPPPIKLNG